MRCNRIQVLITAVCAVLLTTAVAAQTRPTEGERLPAPVKVELSTEYAEPGRIAVVTVWFDGNRQSSGFAGDLLIALPEDVVDVDLSGCLAGNTSMVGTCVHPGGDESRIRILLANDRATPLEPFAGTLVLTLAPDARPGKIPLVWDRASWDVAEPAASVEAIDGQITVSRAGTKRRGR